METVAAGDTWGVPGPAFLIIYVAAVIVVLIAAVLHRRALFAGRGAQVDRLGPQQLAYLNGGDRLAIYASLGGLRTAGAIASAPDKTLWQSGPLPSGMTQLDTAVYNAAGRRIRGRDVGTDTWVAAAVDQLRSGLENAGLAVPAERRRAARRWALAGVALIVLGIVRMVAGMANQKPVGLLFFAIAATAMVTLFLSAKAPTATRSATKAMAEVRAKHQYLSPSQSPAYATYGATGAAMGVALFGTASLFTMDPAFAADAEIQQVAMGGLGGGSTNSCSGSTSCGGGSSCGGGGGCGG
jgi:uncharacterized protein (TIGR04222 family)